MRNIILYWTEMILYSVLFLGILVCINLLAVRHNHRFDMTPEKKFSLSPYTIQLLKTLKDEVKITVFYQKGKRRSIEDLLYLFSQAYPRFRYEFIDLEKNPAKAEKLGISTYNAGVIEYKGRIQTVPYITEENLISSLLELVFHKKGVIYFVKGHGEKDFYDVQDSGSYYEIKEGLERENYKVKTIFLTKESKVPEDAVTLVIAGPKKDLFQKEIEIIDKYLKRGGGLLFLCDPATVPNICNYFKQYGVKIQRDIIIDKQSKLFDLDELTPIVYPVKKNPIIKNLDFLVVLPLCRSIRYEKRFITDETIIRPLLVTSPKSWAESDTESIYEKRATFDKDRDIAGPVTVGISLEIASKEKDFENTRIVIIGDSDFATNYYLPIMGNRDFFLNTINWLAKRGKPLSIRPKLKSQGPVSVLFLTENENRLVLWSSVIIEPGIILLIGIFIIIYRRLKT